MRNPRRTVASTITLLATLAFLLPARSAYAAPSIISVSPTSHANTGSVMMDITGTGFVSGASAKLQKSGQPDIVGTSVTVTGAVITTAHATFDLTAVAPGPWDVRVTNPDHSTDVSSNAFTVTASAPTVTAVSPTSRGQGATNQNISITGTNFAHGAVAL